jgi:DNA polymerase-3 subunit gamma/tau
MAVEREVAPAHNIQIKSFHDVLALLKENREAVLYAGLYHFAHPLKIDGNVMHLALLPGADKNLIPQVTAKLKMLTGQPWLISVTAFVDGMLSLAEQDKNQTRAQHADIQKNPFIQNILTTFKGAKIIQMTTLQENINDPPTEGESNG